jgi:hypothetical protein
MAQAMGWVVGRRCRDAADPFGWLLQGLQNFLFGPQRVRLVDRAPMLSSQGKEWALPRSMTP